MIRVSQAQAVRFILQKNYLAEQKATDLLPLIKDLVGLPGSSTTTPYLAAQTRLAQFKPQQLTKALSESHHLINSKLMRSTSYIVPAADYPALHRATWRQRNQALNAEFRLWAVENDEIERRGEAILDIIGNEPKSLAAITSHLPPDSVRELTQTSRGGRVSTTTNVELALVWLTARGVLCIGQLRPDEPADWRTETLVYAPLREWYPDLDLSAAPGEAETQARLVRTYLAAFGPATEADISFWTGFSKSETARATNALSSETTLTMVEGIPGMLLSLKSQADILTETRVSQAPLINILPADDPFTTAHRASRTRYFTDQKLQRRVFSSSGAAKPTIVVNGHIVGLWDQSGDKLVWRLLTQIDPAWLALIQTKIEQVAAFIDPQMPVEQDERENSP
jgi:hypothetical protein